MTQTSTPRLSELQPCDPVIYKVRGGWLAGTPEGHPYGIAVVAGTEEEARTRFISAFLAWKELFLKVEAERENSKPLLSAKR